MNKVIVLNCLHCKHEWPSRLAQKKVPEKSQKIIEAIRKNPHISRRELSMNLGESEDTIQSVLRKLIKERFIKRVGPDKVGIGRLLGDE